MKSLFVLSLLLCLLSSCLGTQYVEVSNYRTTNSCGGGLLRVDYYPVGVCSAGTKYVIINSTHVANTNCFNGYQYRVAPVDGSCIGLSAIRLLEDEFDTPFSAPATMVTYYDNPLANCSTPPIRYAIHTSECYKVNTIPTNNLHQKQFCQAGSSYTAQYTTSDCSGTPQIVSTSPHVCSANGIQAVDCYTGVVPPYVPPTTPPPPIGLPMTGLILITSFTEANCNGDIDTLQYKRPFACNGESMFVLHNANTVAEYRCGLSYTSRIAFYPLNQCYGNRQFTIVPDQVVSPFTVPTQAIYIHNIQGDEFCTGDFSTVNVYSPSCTDSVDFQGNLISWKTECTPGSVGVISYPHYAGHGCTGEPTHTLEEPLEPCNGGGAYNVCLAPGN